MLEICPEIGLFYKYIHPPLPMIWPSIQLVLILIHAWQSDKTHMQFGSVPLYMLSSWGTSHMQFDSVGIE